MSDTDTDELMEDLELDSEAGELRFEVGPDVAGGRLDVVVSEFANAPRAQVRRWIEGGFVKINDLEARPSRKVSSGDLVTARVPEAEPTDVRPEAISIEVIYEDEDLIVVDKAAGMVVHPGPGHSSGTLVNALLHRCKDLAGVGGVLRPGIVHRLDRGTSGVMVAAKNDNAHTHLSEQFHDHTIGRIYLAFVRALPSAESGEIDAMVGRHPRDRKRMSVRTRSGRQALTRWRVAARFAASGVSKLEIRPETGRTHQIRVHLASQGMPIAGDQVYGRLRKEKRWKGVPIELSRPALHAAQLAFTHPRTAERLDFSAPLPEDLARFEESLVRFDAPESNIITNNNDANDT